jgi:hypothetical protein
MGRFPILIIIYITFLLSSCCNYYKTEYGSSRPKKSKFKFSKTVDKLTDSFLEENHVYTHIDSVYGEDPKTGVIKLSITKSFKRFFKTGQYIQGTGKGLNLSLNDYNNLNSGIIGYYKIQNNKILYEYFLVTAHNCGNYYKSESKIIGDSIPGYQKNKIKGLTGTPNW